MILVDTNVLVYALNVDSPALSAAQRFLDAWRTSLVLAPQALYELYVVCTRPKSVGGLGANPQSAASIIDRYRSELRLMADPADLFEVWLDLVQKSAVSGRRAHDARLVAFMHGHAITRVATFNGKDFQSFEGLEIIVPS